MVQRLREAIYEETKSIETFLNNGIDVLGTRPQTHEEVGEAFKKHADLSKNRKSMEPLLEKANLKNRLLKTVAGMYTQMFFAFKNNFLNYFSVKGDGHEKLFALQGKMEKFKSMVDSHQQVLKDQTEVLRKNLQSRISTFSQDIEKFAAHWHQFKPKERDLEDENKMNEALKLVKDRDIEIQELLKQANKIKYVSLIPIN
jgi:dynein heavy chain 2, cytosolic